MATKTRRWPAIGLLAVFSLALILRLLGPMGALPEKDGYVAICTGSEIVYIPLSELDGDLDGNLDGDSSDEREAHSETCDWFFQFHALATVPASKPEPQALRPVVVLRPAVEHAVHAAALPRGFHARAPPLSVHAHTLSTFI
ncbi:DUF2946 family protein [Rhodobacteraceae bacterium D3-12]|nr:DUF2946 family protein [Rhodobacteraceae bacterium D3-12]